MKKLYEETNIENIATAIREKGGTTDTLKVSEMAEAITNMPSGGGRRPTGHLPENYLRTNRLWTDEQINYFKENILFWDEEDDIIYQNGNPDIVSTYNFTYGMNSQNTSTMNNMPNLMFLPHNITYTALSSLFSGDYNLIMVPDVAGTTTSSLNSLFSNCSKLKEVGNINIPNTTNASSMFYGCYGLEKIGGINCNKNINFSSFFFNCYSLKKIPMFSTSYGTNFQSMFNNCRTITTIPLLNTSNGTNFSQMFRYCYHLREIPQIDTSKGTNFDYMFNYTCMLDTIPQIDTSKGTTFQYCFQYSYVTTLPELDFSSCISSNAIFNNASYLANVGGLKDLGKAFLTTQSANYSNYKLDLSSCSKLTEQSLINILNDLYDIATKGVQTQTCNLGTTNLRKLTSEEGIEALANARTKGWTVS